MINYREFSWWYWAATDVLLFVGLAGHREAFILAVVLSAVQIVHFRWLTVRSSPFPRKSASPILACCFWRSCRPCAGCSGS